MMPKKVLKVENLRYGSVLKGLNFEWHQGEIIALMGVNGSGKSTLARLLAGLVEPDEGEIKLKCDGDDCDWNSVKRWQEIGLVGQHPRRQTIGATVGEDLGFGLLNLGKELPWVQQKVRELAATIGLAGKEDQSPSTLSGGERQRLVTAAILSLEPSFIILDEALTMLDTRAQANVLELLFQVRRETGQLWITHDVELACQADRLWILHEGLIEDVGSPKEVFIDNELLTRFGLKVEKSSVAKRLLKSSISRVDRDKVHEVPIQNQPALEWKEANFESRIRLNSVVRQGEFIGIVGPSGSGKTTLLESAMGLIKATEGALYVCGKPITKKNFNTLNSYIRLVPQEAGEYLIGRSVLHEIYYGESRKGLANNRMEKLSLLQEFGLSVEKAEVAPESLSGGERQKVALAAALKTQPGILLLDEPLLGLDVSSRVAIKTIISGWKGITILYVTHDLREVLQDADRIWLIENGKLILDCPSESWKDHQKQFQEAGVRC